MRMDEKEISNAELCAMWLNDEIPLSEYMRNFKDVEEQKREKVNDYRIMARY